MSYFLILAALFIPLAAQAAEPEGVAVLEAAGRAEVWRSGSGKWSELSAGAMLKKGDKIRAGGESFVEMALDEKFETILRLDHGSRIDVLSLAPPRFALERGRFFIFGEGEKGSPLKVLTPFAVCSTSSIGGFALETSRNGLRVWVYGGQVSVIGRRKSVYPVKEGFKFFLHGASSRVLERMTYPDYWEWTAWSRKVYERKDDRDDYLKSLH
ncbi:MAG: hypothetical protein HY592_03870 [Candidatus Omnitrophica bacterium]|nr:hypothetical protein [Candidatus Omnitrophota bacterium]